jgi:transcriptional regulator with XRE-family HTH domain
MNDNDEFFSMILEDFEKEISFSETEKVKNKMHLSILIDESIKRRGWSKSQFANEINQNPSVITKWLSGTHNFTIDTLTDIGLILKIDLLNIPTLREEEIAVEEPKFIMVAVPTSHIFQSSIDEACINLTLSSMSNKTNTTANKSFYSKSETIS